MVTFFLEVAKRQPLSLQERLDNETCNQGIDLAAFFESQI
jgi:hypothetical protein